jgi:hypothetical protein
MNKFIEDFKTILLIILVILVINLYLCKDKKEHMTTDIIQYVNSELEKKFDKSGGTINGNINIKGYLTGTNFTMNTGNNLRIETVPNSGMFRANGVYFGSGACHGNIKRFGSCP